MRIYTKTGDTGETGLVGGERVHKTNPRVESYGTVDELNASIGVVRAHGVDPWLDEKLDRIQRLLFDIGTELATPQDSPYSNPTLGEAAVLGLEAEIDAMTTELEPLRNFILPGGSLASAHLNLARTICRRAERDVLRFDAVEPVRDELKRFLNRLSDWLFVAGRRANQQAGVPDVKWAPGNQNRP